MRNLDASGGPPDYPRAAADFHIFGAPEFAIFCWLAAGRPHIAEAMYERSVLHIVDNQLSSRSPIWRMIVGAKTGDMRLVKEGYAEYVIAITTGGDRVPPWVERALSLI